MGKRKSSNRQHNKFQIEIQLLDNDQEIAMECDLNSPMEDECTNFNK